VKSGVVAKGTSAGLDGTNLNAGAGDIVRVGNDAGDIVCGTG
jgi:hypothetical protein